MGTELHLIIDALKVLAYAQQSRERSNYELAALTERMQEFKRQIDRERRWSSNGSHDSPNGDGIQAVGRSSHKMIEAVMQTAVKGKVLIFLNTVMQNDFLKKEYCMSFCKKKKSPWRTLVQL